MTISLIAAMDKNLVIGKKNALPWYLPADLRHFKKLTTGKPVIMGSATFASIGRALPDRINIVMTRDPALIANGCVIVHSVKEALAAARPNGRLVGQAQGHDEIMVIGGATVFEQFLPRAQKIYLTMIDAEIDGDVYFPEWNPAEWRETSREQHAPDEKNKYTYAFLTLERIKEQ